MSKRKTSPATVDSIADAASADPTPAGPTLAGIAIGSMNSNSNSTADAISTIAPADLLDLNQLRLPQDFDDVGVQRTVLTVPVKKPENQWFIRVHPGPDYRAQVYLLDLRDSREVFMVHPNVKAWVEDATPVQLYLAITRQGFPFLWPVKLPSTQGGRRNEWHHSAMAAAEMAMTRWMKVRANMGLGGYEAFAATGIVDEPEWPALSFQEIVSIAFRHRVIDTPDHEVLLRLRGEK